MSADTPTRTDQARAWLARAEVEQPGLVRLLKRLTFHRNVKWQMPDYVPGYPDEREVTTNIEETEAFSSALKPHPWDDEPGHAVLVDLDVEAYLTPSSRPGHGHLWVNIPHGVKDDDLWAWFEAGVKIGLVEEGYYQACKERGMTSLRAPWVKKEPGDG